MSPAGRICRCVYLPLIALPTITVPCLPGVRSSLNNIAQPRDAGGLPRGANASQDRIVRAVIEGISARQGSEKRGTGGGTGKAKTESRGGPNKKRTFVIKSRASAETFDGIRRSTFAIRLYVAGTASEDPRQH